MWFTIIPALIVIAIAAEMRTHHALQQKLLSAWIGLQTSFLPATHVTLDQSQIGHIVPVNDDLLLIRHLSGHIAFLPTRHQMPTDSSVGTFVKMLALVFFSL